MARIDRDWRASLQGETTTVAKESQCFFVAAHDSREIQKGALCGPIRRLGDEATSWDSVNLDVADGADGKALITPLNNFSRGAALNAGFDLVRPDGNTPPSDLNLAAPKAPPAAANAVAWLQNETEPSMTMSVRPAPEKATLITPEYTFRVKEVGTVSELGSGADVRSAPSGSSFRAITIEVSDAPATPTITSDDPQAPQDVQTDLTATVQVGADKRDTSWTLATGTQTLVAVVPNNATDPKLTIAVNGVDQSLSLTTGERVSSTAAAFYDRSSPSIAVANGVYSGSNTAGDFKVSSILQFDHAWRVPFFQKLGWASEGDTYVVVPDLQAATSVACCTSYTATEAHGSVRLIDDSNHTYYDAFENKPGKYSVFEVPNSATSFTFVVEPTINFSADSSYYTPQAGTVTLPKKTWSLTFK